MKVFSLFLFAFLSTNAFALRCDCEVRVYSPIRASNQMPATTLKVYELEEFSSYSVKNQKACRDSCQKTYEDDMPTERLMALLSLHTKALIGVGVLGYNCTGLTVAKYPVRVKASLGLMGLGNVGDIIQVVPVEKVCFY